MLVELLEETPGAGGWISFSCRDGSRISDGTPIASLAAELGGSPRVLAVGVNCTAPRHVGPLIAAVRRATAKPIVVYPNSGETYDPRRKRWRADERSEALAAAAAWVELGARLVGGCCRTGPAEIRDLRRRLLPAPDGQRPPGGASPEDR